MPTYLYFLLWGALFFVLMRFGCGVHIMGGGHRHGGNDEEPDGTHLRDTNVPTVRAERNHDH